MSTPIRDIYPNADDLAVSVAEQFLQLASNAVEQRGRFTVALAGGSTPRALYQRLASGDYRDHIPWDRTHVFLGDERYVPLDHPDSNFRMIRESLLDHVPVPDSQVHPVPTEREPADAARDYERTIREVFDTPQPGVPSFDLILLGIGADGHTASLFPETEALEVEDRLVIENWVPQQDAMRITFTIPMLHQARTIILMAAGQDKAEAVARAIEAPRNLAETPSQCLRDARGDVILVLEHAAAAQLSDQPPQPR